MWSNNYVRKDHIILIKQGQSKTEIAENEYQRVKQENIG